METFVRQIRRFLQNKKHAKTMRKTMTALAVVVIFVTTYALVLPAVTMDKDTAAAEAGLVLEDEAKDVGKAAEENADKAEAEETKAPETEKEPETEAPAEPATEGLAGIAAESGDAAKADEAKDAGDASADPDKAEEKTDAAPADETASKEETKAAETTAAAETGAEETTATEETAPQGVAGELTYELEDVVITVSFDKEAGIPEGAKLAVEEITEKSKDYDAYTEKAEEAVLEKTGDEKESTKAEVIRLFDIKILMGDKKVDLNDKVKVKIAYKTPLTVSEDVDLHTVHFVDEEKEVKKLDVKDKKDIEVLKTETETGKTVTTEEGTSTEVKEIQFDTDGFSVYGIVGTETITVDYLTHDGKSYKITVEFDEREELSEDMGLNVNEILEGSEDYEKYLSEAKLAMGLAEDDKVGDARFFDIEIIKDGEKYEPAYPATVTIQCQEAMQIGEDETLNVVHFADKGTEVIEEVAANDEGTEFVFEQGSFSVTGVISATFTSGWPSGNNGDKKILILQQGTGSSAVYYALKTDLTLTPVVRTEGGTGNLTINTSIQIDGNVDLDDYYWTYEIWNNNNHAFSDGNGNYLDPATTGFLSTTRNALARTNAGRIRRNSGGYKYFRIQNGTLTQTTTDNQGAIFYFADNFTTDGSQISDDIRNSGNIIAELDSGTEVGENYKFVWYRQKNNGEWEEVTRVKVSGDDYNTGTGVADESSTALENAWVNVALDDGAKTSSTTTSYKVVLQNAEGETVLESQPYEIPYYDSIQNGSFETPRCTSYNSYQPYINSGADGIIWKTTASDGKIEMVSVENSSYQSLAQQYHHVGDASDGTQFAELNANNSGSLYQDVLTVPGAMTYWSIAHRGRGNSNSDTGEDTMYVLIMSTALAEQYNVTSQTMVNYVISHIDEFPGASVTTCKASNVAWVTNTGDYEVPEGQYLTRFFFVAGPTASGDDTVGNHIDAVSFGEDIPAPNPDKVSVLVTKVIDGSDLDAADVHTLEQNIKFTVTSTDIASINGVVINDSSHPMTWVQNGTTYTGTYAFRDISIGANQGSKSVTVKESNADVEGYSVTSQYKVGDGSYTEGTEASGSVAGGEVLSIGFSNAYEVQSGSVTFTKVDDFDNAVPNAVFTLYEDSECVTALQKDGSNVTATSGSDGTVTFSDISLGTYYMKETTVPTGYLANDTVYEVEIKASGSTVSGNTNYKVVNHDATTITVSKTWKNADGSVIEAPENATVVFTLGTLENDEFTSANTAVTLNGEVDDTPDDSATAAGYESSAWSATFKNLRKYDDSGNEITYQVKETTGYTDYSVDGSDTAGNEGTITNKQNPRSVTFKKMNADKDTYLNGATFTLYQINSSGIPEEYMSFTIENGETGVVKEIAPGFDYKLVENDPPTGYIKLVDGVYFSVTDTVSMTTDDSGATKTDSAYAEATGLVLTVYNVLGSQLPMTGGSGTLPYTLGGLALICAAAMMYGFRMRRRERRSN